jgi:NADP+-dependent farnesol dehydrogenase
LLLLLLLLQELEGSLQSESGKLYALKCDITKEEDIKEAFKWVKDNLGGVDILVNNAAGDRRNTLCGNSDITCVYSPLAVPPVLSTSRRQFKQYERGLVINTIRL